MKKFRLKLSNRNIIGENLSWADNMFDEIMSLERKYQAMSVFLYSANYEKFVKMLVKISARNGTQIRSLLLSDCAFEDLHDFCDILTNLPLLEELEIKRSTFKTPVKQLSSIKHVTLKHLKTLTIDSSNWAMFQCLITPQIEKFKAALTRSIYKERDHFVNFLENSASLKSFEIDTRAYEIIFETEAHQRISFKLKKFTLILYVPPNQERSPNTHENLEKFLAEQTLLEDMKLNYISGSAIEKIFRNMKFLKVLQIASESLPDNEAFYKDLKPLESLKEFIVHGEMPSEIAAKGILKRLPYLETLDAPHDPRGILTNLLPSINIYQPNLKSLSIHNLGPQLEPEVIFRNLEFLHIETIANFDRVIKFLKTHPKVETFSLHCEHVHQPISGVFDILISEVNLKHLKFIADAYTAKLIQMKLLKNYKKLESLELTIPEATKKLFYYFESNGEKMRIETEFLELEETD